MPLTTIPRLRGLVRMGEAGYPTVRPQPDGLFPGKGHHVEWPGKKQGGFPGGGRGKKGGGGGAPFEYNAPEVETYDMSTLTGTDELILTDINGIDLGEFSHITLNGRNVKTSAATAGMELWAQVSEDGGSTWITTGMADAKAARSEFGHNITDTGAKLYIETTPAAGWMFISEFHDMDAVCPTAIKSQEMHAGDSMPHHLMMMVRGTAAIHNAIRVYLEEPTPGTTKWASGSIQIVGYRGTEEVTVQSVTCSGEDELFFNIPAGHTMCGVYADDAETSTDNALRIQTSVAGTPDAGATDYQYHYFRDLYSAGGTTSRFALTYTAVFQAGYAELWGLNTEGAQINGYAYSIKGGGVVEGGVLRKTTAIRSQIRVFPGNDADTMDGGTIYVVSRKIQCTKLLTIDQSIAPTVDHVAKDFTDSMVVVSSFDNTTTGNSDRFMTLSEDNGVTYLDTNEYNYAYMASGGDGAAVGLNEWDVCLYNSIATQSFSFGIKGLNVECYAINSWGSDMRAYSGARNRRGAMNVSANLNAVKVRPHSSYDWLAGIYHAMSFRL